MEDHVLSRALLEVARRLREGGYSDEEARSALDLGKISSALGLYAATEGAPTPPTSTPVQRPPATNAHPATMVEGDRSSPVRRPSERRVATQTVGRLRLGSELGRGGMGKVVEAFDPELQRKVAVKLLLDSSKLSKKRLSRFVSEAQITAQLDHPNIVPVHEMGASPEGEVFFVMKRVRGRSMRDIFLALTVGDRATQRDWTRRRLLQALVQVCNALAYAHERGVIHRDLKPDNIMLGDFGEVYVMDWGVARVLGEEEERGGEGIQRMMTPGTLDGATIGTPGYMSPEQGTGDLNALDGQSDVWSLGAILYEILTWQRAYDNENMMSLVVEAATTRPMPPRERAPERQIPEEIAEVCLKALSLDKAERYRDVTALAAAIEGFLEGAARKRAAAKRLIEGEQRWARHQVLDRRALELAACEEALEEFYPSYTPLEERQGLQEVRQERDALERERVECFEGVVAACEGALSHDPDNAPARALMAEVFWERLLESEAKGEALTARQHAARVRAYGGHRDRVLLRGTGSLTLRTSPEGARVTCQRVVQEGLIWGLGEPEFLGETPIERSPLEMGSYLLTIEWEGGRLRYPVYITRDRHWHSGRAPLRLDADVGAGFVRVAGGMFQRGGDAQAQGGAGREEVWVEAFSIAQHPITLGEYCEFINALAEEDSVDAAWARVPRVKASGGQLWERPVEGSAFVVPRVDRDGDLWDARWPVSNVSWNDAKSYVRWRSAKDGRRYGLPTEREWEKAARGVDGRVFPWGARFDATLCKMRDSRSSRSTPEPVGSFAADCSVYGVRDVAGGVQEWCADPAFNGDPDRRVTRGGSWQSEAHGCRLAARRGVEPWRVSPDIGFRLVRRDGEV